MPLLWHCLRSLIPLLNEPGVVNNFITQMATGGINAQYNARVDHHFSDKNMAAGGGSVVDGSVTDALRQWRFRPPLINGQPATASVIIEVSFQLPDRVSSRILDPPRATRPAQQ